MAPANDLLQQLLRPNAALTSSRDAVAGFNYIPQKAGDEKTALGVGLGQALLSGILDGIARDQQRERGEALSSVIKELYTNPTQAIRPDVLDAGDFEALRSQYVLDRAVQEQTQTQDFLNTLRTKELDFQYDMKGKDYLGQGTIFQSLMNNPVIANEFRKDPTGAAAKYGIELPNARSATVTAEPAASVNIGSVLEDDSDSILGRVLKEDGSTPAANPIGVVLNDAPKSTTSSNKQQKADFVDVMADSEIPTQTISEIFDAEYAKGLDEFGDPSVAKERAALVTKPLVEEAALMKKADSEQFGALVDRQNALFGVREAIDRYQLQGVLGEDLIAGIAQKIAAIDPTGESAKLIQDRAPLSAMDAMVTRIFRTAGEGVISDKDMENFKKGLPHPSKTKAENLFALEKLEKAITAQESLIKLRSAYIDKYGSLRGFDRYEHPLKENFKALFKAPEFEPATLDSVGSEIKEATKSVLGGTADVALTVSDKYKAVSDIYNLSGKDKVKTLEMARKQGLIK